MAQSMSPARDSTRQVDPVITPANEHVSFTLRWPRRVSVNHSRHDTLGFRAKISTSAQIGNVFDLLAIISKQSLNNAAIIV